MDTSVKLPPSEFLCAGISPDPASPSVVNAELLPVKSITGIIKVIVSGEKLDTFKNGGLYRLYIEEVPQ